MLKFTHLHKMPAGLAQYSTFYTAPAIDIDSSEYELLWVNDEGQEIAPAQAKAHVVKTSTTRRTLSFEEIVDAVYRFTCGTIFEGGIQRIPHAELEKHREAIEKIVNEPGVPFRPDMLPELPDEIFSSSPVGRLHQRYLGVVPAEIRPIIEGIESVFNLGSGSIYFTEGNAPVHKFRVPFLRKMGHLQRIYVFHTLWEIIGSNTDTQRSTEFTKITDQTSSLGVIEYCGYICKLYDKIEDATKECMIMRKAFDTNYLAGLVQIPSLFYYERTSDLTKSKTEVGEIFGTAIKLDLTTTIVISEYDEFQNHIPDKTDHLVYSQKPDFIERSRAANRRRERIYKAVCEDSAVNHRRIAANPLITRMYILSVLHGEFIHEFNNEERSSLAGDNNFSYDDIEGKLGTTLGEFTRKFGDEFEEIFLSYDEAKQQLERVHVMRENAAKLIFVHGDAKYDNWGKYGPIDFGSAKIATEYKDIAKALLDSSYLMNPLVIRQLTIDQLLDGVSEESFSSFCQFQLAMGNEIKNYKYLRPQFRHLATLLRMPDGKEKAEEFISGTLSYEEVREEVGKLYGSENRWVDQSELIDDYIQLYFEFRKHTSIPIEEEFDSFRHNVYNAIITECVRTIAYKWNIPGQRQLCTEFKRIGLTFAKRAGYVE